MKASTSYVRRILPGFAGLVGVIALLVLSLANEYRNANQHAQVEVENISRVLDEQALATVQKADLLMRDVLGDVHPDDMRLARGANSPRAKELHALLKSHFEMLPELSVLHLTNAKGEHILSSLAELPHIDISDRYHFLRQRDDPNAGLVISLPVISRTTGKWTLILTRRINFEDGSFAGTITAVLEPEYFQKFYRSLDMGTHGVISLFDKEMNLIARFPPSEKDMGKKVNIHAKTYIENGINHATYHAKSALDGVDRIYNFRQVGDLPLFVFVGLAEDDYLAEWRRHVWEYGISLVVFCFVVVGFWLRKLSAEEKLLISGRRHQLLFDSSRDALMMLAPPSWKFTGANQATLKLFGASSVAEFTSLGPWDVSPERQPDGCSSSEKAQKMIAIAMNEGSHNFEWKHQRLNGQSFAADVLLTRMEVGTEVFLQATVRDITERKTLERQNIQHSQNIRALINATNESSFLLAPDGVVLAINDTALRRLRLTKDEALGKDLFDLLPPEVAAKRRAIFLDVVQSHKPVTAEDERAGIKFLATYTPILDETGKVTQVAVYGTDVTERRQLEAIEQLLPTVTHKILRGAPLQEVLNLVCSKTVEGFGIPLAWAGKKMKDGSISVLAASGPELSYMSAIQGIGVRWDDSPFGSGVAGLAIRTGEIQHMHANDPHFSPWVKEITKHGIRSSLAVPLILRDKVYGAFILYSRQDAQFDSPAFLKRIGILRDNICLSMEMATDQEQITLLSTAVFSASNAVMITDPKGRIVWVNPAFVMQSGYASTELIGRTPSILNSGKYDAAYYRHMWQTIMDGKVWSGDTTNKRKDGTLYTVQQTITPILDENGKITHFVSVHEDVTAKLETQAHIEYIASHDALTGLPNRALFFDRLGQLCNLSKRNQTNLAVLFIDLDGFKLVNDKLGHPAGDLLLKSVAGRLQACVRGSDTVARLGGDEFTIILFDISGREIIVHLAEKILSEMSRPFDLDGQSAAIGASIGIATAITAPEGNICDDRLVERADAAMYEAKHAGKNCYRFASEQ